jgi:hypothetical protein
MNAHTHSGPHIDCTVLLQRLRLRGFPLNSKEEACHLGPWLRFTPTLQALIFGLSTITGSDAVLMVMAGILAVGLVTGCHPFDLIYAGVIRPLEKSPELPPSPIRRRLVFLLGVMWCLTTAWAFHEGHQLAGYILGGIMTASTTLLAATHICIPSLVMDLFGRITRKPSRTASSENVSRSDND